RLFLLRITQVAIVVTAADHAEQGHAAALSSAQQHMQRLPARAPGEVVQRDFDSRFGAEIAVHAAIHRSECTFNVSRVAAAHRPDQLGHGGTDALERRAGVYWWGCSFAPAHQPGVAFYADQTRIGPPDFLARHDDGLDHRQADRNRLDGFDVHLYSLIIPDAA